MPFPNATILLPYNRENIEHYHLKRRNMFSASVLRCPPPTFVLFPCLPVHTPTQHRPCPWTGPRLRSAWNYWEICRAFIGHGAGWY